MGFVIYPSLGAAGFQNDIILLQISSTLSVYVIFFEQRFR